MKRALVLSMLLAQSAWANAVLFGRLDHFETTSVDFVDLPLGPAVIHGNYLIFASALLGSSAPGTAAVLEIYDANDASQPMWLHFSGTSDVNSPVAGFDYATNNP